MQVVVEGLSTRYKVAGKGKVVLLLHGWGDSLEGLANLQTHLSISYRVVSVDLPGFGQTAPPEAAWGLDNYATYLSHFLKTIGVNKLYAVVGHSNGGALAIRAVATGQLTPQKLVLLAAAGIRRKSGLKRMVVKIIAKTGGVATIWMPERYRQLLRKSLYGVGAMDKPASKALQRTLKETTSQDVQTDARKIAIPTLLVYANNDRAVTPEDGDTYHQLIKDSTLKILAGSHFIHQDRPTATIETIKEFLA